MALRLTLLSSLRFFRQHPAQLMLAVLGLAIGVAAVVSVEAARSTIAESFAGFTRQMNGRATHRIVARDGYIRDAEYLELRRRYGALPMAPLLETRVRDAQGMGWKLLGVDVVVERQFREFTGQVLGDDVFPLADWLAGQPLALAAKGMPAELLLANGQRLTLLATLDPDQLGGADRLLIVDLGLAQRLAGAALPADAISQIELIASPAQVQQLELPTRLILRPIAQQQTAALSQAFELNLLALSLLALMVGAFIVFNTMRFFVLQRQHLFALKRLLGMTTLQLARVVALEALLIGLLGTAVGLALGLALADGVLRQMAGTVNALYYEVSAAQARLGPLMWFKALAVGLGGALLAALLPALEAARSHTTLPGMTRISPRVSRSMAAAGGVALALSLFLQSLPALLAALGAVFFAALGYVLVAVPLGIGVAAQLKVSLHRSLLRGFAISRLPFTLNRTAPALAALVLAVATVVGVDHMISSFRSSVVSWLEHSLTAQAYLAVRDEEDRLPPPLVAQLAQRPEVVDRINFVTREIVMERGKLTLSAQQLNEAARGSFRFLSSWPTTGWQQWQSGGVLLSEPLARRLQLAAGDHLVLPTPTAESRLPVLGIFADYRSDGGRAVVSMDTYRRHWGGTGLTSVGLYFQPGQAQSVLDWLADEVAADPRLRLARTAEIRRLSLRIFDRTFDLTRGLKWLAAAVAFVGVLGAVMALQLERRHESALLATLGMAATDRARLLGYEALGLGLAAGLLALPLGAGLAWLLTDLINLRAFGWTLTVQWQPATFLFGLGLAITAAMAGAAYPLWEVLRHGDDQDPVQ